jgi:hypothetical protein
MTEREDLCHIGARLIELRVPGYNLTKYEQYELKCASQHIEAALASISNKEKKIKKVNHDGNKNYRITKPESYG